nr:hypothetical protein [Tanacetum cinerariifolium]
MYLKINLRAKTGLEEIVEKMMIVMMSVMMMDNDDKEEEHEEEYVHTPEKYESTDDEDKHVDKEEYDHFDEEFYKYVNVKWNVTKHRRRERRCRDVRHEKPSIQTPSLLTIPITVIHETSTTSATNIPPYIPLIAPLPQPSTPTPTPTTEATTTLILKLERPSTPDPDWNDRKSVDFRPPQTWIITNVKVIKWYDYGYLEDIEVRIEDQQVYKFKEGDFPRLHMHDIEDMLLLLVQKKLSNPDGDVIFDLGVALRMFTRHKYKRNKLMRSDELYKFSDGNLTSVRDVLHDIASNLRMEYLPKRRWSNLDRQRSRIMINAIDKLLLERRLMRSLEKFVGGRDYEEDLKLLERTI